MYVKIAAYRKNKGEPLECMTEGGYEEVFKTLATLTAAVLENFVANLPDNQKEETREEFYEVFINDMRRNVDNKIIDANKEEF